MTSNKMPTDVRVAGVLWERIGWLMSPLGSMLRVARRQTERHNDGAIRKLAGNTGIITIQSILSFVLGWRNSPAITANVTVPTAA